MDATENLKKHREARLVGISSALEELGLRARLREGSKQGAQAFVDTLERFALEWYFMEPTDTETPWLLEETGWNGRCLIAGEPALITVTPCLLERFCYCTVTPVQLTDGKRKAAGKVTLTPRRRDRLAAWLAVQRVSHVRLSPQFGMRPWLPAEAVASVALSSPKALAVVREAAATPLGETAQDSYRVRVSADVGRSVWLSKATGFLVAMPEETGGLPPQWSPIGWNRKQRLSTMRILRRCAKKHITGTMGTALRNGRNKAAPT